MSKSVTVMIGCLLLMVLVLSGCGTAATTTVAPTTSAAAVTTTAPVTTSTAPKTTSAVNPVPLVTTTAPPTTSSAQKRGGVLVIQAPTGPGVFGIPTQLGADSQSTMIAIPAIETLLSYDDSGVAQPVLAESWKVDQAAKTITFSIRKGINFSDGTPCDASAVAWNLDQFIQTKNSAADAWLSVAVLDPYTVMLKLVEYKATALAAFDSYAGMMISPTAYKLNGADWAKTHPIGTGPFVLKSFTRDTVTEFVKNPNYWQPGKPYLDGIKIVVIPDTTTARMTFEAGQIDVVRGITGDVANALQAKGNKIDALPGTIATLIPDSKNAASPFAKLAVRQAVEYAIDKASLATSLGYGYMTPMTQAAATYQSGYNKDLAVRNYDPAKAKQLLKDAGYTSGPTISITTSSIYNADLMVAMMNYLNAAGFKCSVNTVTQASWTTMSTGGWTNSLFYSPLSTTDAEYVSFLDRYYSTSSLRYPVLLKPTAITDVITQAIYEKDYAKRAALSQQAVRMMQEDCTTIPITLNPGLSAEKAYVMDTHFNTITGVGFRWDCINAWLNK